MIGYKMGKRLIVLLAVSMLIAGCQGDSSLEQQTQDRALSSHVAPGSFHLMGRREFSQGTITIYSVANPDNPDFEKLGFVVFQNGMLGRKIIMDGEWNRDVSAFASDQLIDYTISDFEFEPLGKGGVFWHVLIYGQVLSPQVNKIQLHLADGSMIEDNGNGDVFALPVSKTIAVCSLQVIGHHNEILKSISHPVNQIDQPLMPPVNEAITLGVKIKVLSLTKKAFRNQKFNFSSRKELPVRKKVELLSVDSGI